MVIFYKTWKKCHEIQLTKNKKDLNKSKMKKNSEVHRRNNNGSKTLSCDTPETTSKGKVFYGQEPPSGESTTTECGFNYQLLAVMY